MSPESDFERFRDIVERDEALTAALWQTMEPTAFVAQVIRLASDRGLTVVEGDVWSAMAAGRQVWLAIWNP